MLTPLRIRSDAGFLILTDMELKDVFVKDSELFARFEAPGKAYDYPLTKKIAASVKKTWGALLLKDDWNKRTKNKRSKNDGRFKYFA